MLFRRLIVTVTMEEITAATIVVITVVIMVVITVVIRVAQCHTSSEETFGVALRSMLMVKICQVPTKQRDLKPFCLR